MQTLKFSLLFYISFISFSVSACSKGDIATNIPVSFNAVSKTGLLSLACSLPFNMLIDATWSGYSSIPRKIGIGDIIRETLIIGFSAGVGALYYFGVSQEGVMQVTKSRLNAMHKDILFNMSLNTPSSAELIESLEKHAKTTHMNPTALFKHFAALDWNICSAINELTSIIKNKKNDPKIVEIAKDLLQHAQYHKKYILHALLCIKQRPDWAEQIANSNLQPTVSPPITFDADAILYSSLVALFGVYLKIYADIYYKPHYFGTYYY